MVSALGEFTINRFPEGEPAGYPTLCKGRFVVEGKDSYLFEDTVSLDILSQLDALKAAGVTALKIEGRQRGRSYVSQVVTEIRRRLDSADRSGRQIAAAAAARPAASISRLIAAFAILSRVSFFDEDEPFRLVDFAIASLPFGLSQKTLQMRNGSVSATNRACNP